MLLRALIIFTLVIFRIDTVLSQVASYSIENLKNDFEKGNHKNIVNHNAEIKSTIIPSIKSDSEKYEILIDLYSSNEICHNNKNALEYAELFVELCSNIVNINYSPYESGLILCLNQSLIINDQTKALKFAKLGIELNDTIQNPNFDNYTLFLENAASLQFNLNDIRNAKQNYLKLNIIYGRQLPAKNEDYFDSKMMLAACELSSKQYENAEDLANECFQYYKTKNNNNNELYVTSLNLLFSCYVMNNKLFEASQIEKDCFSLTIKYFGENSEDYLDLLHMSAIYYNALGEFNLKSVDFKIREQSVENFNKAIKLGSKCLSLLLKTNQNGLQKNEVNGLISLSYFFLTEYDKGIEYALKSNNNAIKTFYYLQMKQNQKADSIFLDYIDQTNVEFENLSNYLINEDQMFLQSKQMNFNNIGLMNYAKLRGSNNLELIKTSFTTWTYFNGIIRTKQKELNQFIDEGSNLEIVNLFSDYNDLKIQVNKMKEFNVNSIYDNKIDEKQDSIALLEGEIKLLFSKENFSIEKITSNDIQRNLEINEAYIEIVKVPTFDFLKGKITDSINYHIFIIKKDQDEFINYSVIENGNNLDGYIFDDYISSIRNTTENPLNPIFFNSFWLPISEKLKDTKTIYVSLGGVYNKININTLYNPESKKYLIEEKDIRIVNNAREFLLNKENISSTKNITSASLYGFPDYNQDLLYAKNTNNFTVVNQDLNRYWIDSLSRGGFNVSVLPETKKEVENIGQLFQKNGWQVKSYTGTLASESNIKKENSPSVLHIATHGYFFEDVSHDDMNNFSFEKNLSRFGQDPMFRSGLLFSGANNTLQGKEFDNENGLLSAAEVSHINLNNTALVVLSACETGKGTIINGEGVHGLRKAFADAGAQNIIMSLWKVDDKVTQEFMSRFYEIWLNEKTSIREAFNRTQLEIKAKYPQPYYWGAFILVGE